MTTQITRLFLKVLAFAMAFVGMYLFFGEENEPNIVDFFFSVIFHKLTAVALFFAAFNLFKAVDHKSVIVSHKSNR